MAVFVADASVALAWCFEDEGGGFADGLLHRLSHGDRIVVPAHWPAEILNGLLVASRRKRIKPDEPALFWEELSRISIETEPPLDAMQGKIVLALAESHSVTIYDAAYLELAHRRQLPLGTLDTELSKAAQAAGVALV